MQKKFKVGDVVQALDGNIAHDVLGSKHYTVGGVARGLGAEALLRLEGKDGYWAGDCFAVVAEPELQVGDIVRCIDDKMSNLLRKGEFYTVKALGPDYLTLEETDGIWRPDRFTLYARVIDRKNPPKCDSMPPTFEKMREENAKNFAAALDALGIDRERNTVDPHADTVPPPAPADEACHAAEDRFNETFHALRNNLDAATMNDMLPQALRYNKNKPESDYIFTYEGGISAVFDESFDYYDTLIALRDLYNTPDSSTARLDEAVSDVLVALRKDANDAGDDIIQMLAETNRRGGIKYIPGNYLKGANWRQYFQSGARHAQKLQSGEEWEYDATLVVEAEKKGLYTEDLEKGFPHRGNFFFNVLALCHCIILGIGTDDRIKAP